MRSDKETHMPSPKGTNAALSLPKSPTGIHGLDEITFGGLPSGRPTLVCGGPGCGKTLLGMEFLVRGATRFGEPGVCLSFEETAEELGANMASLGFDVAGLAAQKKLAIDYVQIERRLVEEAGEYDLEALFVRLAYAVESIGAKRVLLDNVESLFAGLSDESVLRAELRRLFRWLKDRGLTTIVTCERGERSLTRRGLEEYISDCVILLDHRVAENVFTRRLRIVKYRGSTHGTNEYPFLIDDTGFAVVPVTSAGLKHAAAEERISTGVAALDEMLGGQGIYRGSSVLISGTAGTGKTTLTAHFADAACARGERCLIFSFDESSEQMARNMRSIGIDLARWIDRGLLEFHAARPTMFGLETHLVGMHRLITNFQPANVVVDPVSSLLHSGSGNETRSMILRMVDFLKENGITAVLTALASGEAAPETTDLDISSLVDAWVLLRDIESGGERKRGIYVIKARGLPNSNQVREFLMTSRGVQLQDTCVGQGGVLTGSARLAQEARDRREEELASQALEMKRLATERKRRALEAQIAAFEAELQSEERELQQQIAEEELRRERVRAERREMAVSRSAQR
jgi:circadian clock protein KaiC